MGLDLWEAFLKHGDEVTYLDNFSTGKERNIISFIQNYPDKFKLILGDIRNL